ncbi:PAS domain-containing protein [Algoriphagus sp. D3-2-R+10]|uniref:PAS domain-containing protein n=1 Tax=Algoriphagus aurantiacus TaxID=3103948 RepID=UPI002B38F729|nr:PAS domain-containing protein [Algoriphagus sp. D3-2-R+10]MEB2774281.1 PAS domain-containing protein [Algoriphagus sp. D3-2-R+10]
MLTNENILGFLVAFIPACVNIAILIYILRFMPRGKLINIFSFLILSVIALQLEHSLVRLNVSESFARFVNQVFSIGWLAMGCLVLHFSVVFTENKLMNSTFFYFLLYAPYIFFFSLYHANPTPVPHVANKVWGYIIEFRPNSLDHLQRYWMAVLVFLGIIILLNFAFSKKGERPKKKQSLIITIGIIIPSIQGVITQLVFPMLGKEQIPVTSTFITFLSITIIIALTRYKLFNISESLKVKEVLNKLTIPVFCISPDKNLIYFNSAFEDIFGICSNKLHSEISHIFLNKEEYTKFCKKLCKGSGKTVKNYEATMLAYNEKPVHMLLSSYPIYNNEKSQGILFFANDITERIKTEEELKVSNQRYKIITKATAEVVWDLDIEKDLIFWGEGYKRLFNYDLKENITDTNHWKQRVHPDDYEYVINSLESHLKNNKSHKWEVEYRYRKSDDSYANILDRGYILRNSAGKALRMVGAMQDITFTKAYIQKIENQNTSLKEIAWLQSHVVRAPLAKIMAINNLLMEDGQNPSEKSMLMDALGCSCKELDEVIHEVSRKIEKIKSNS